MAEAIKKAQVHRTAPEQWREKARPFERSCDRRAGWQLLNSAVPYVLLWILMYFALNRSWWLVPPLAFLAGGLLIRIFIIFHDCGHGIFFTSRWANQSVGFFCGLLVFTPYRQWHRDHADHHATAGNLDGRGPGEVWTMTVEEFRTASVWKQRMYRLMRNPFVLFGVVPILFFVVLQRLPMRAASRSMKQSIWIMNLAALVYVSLMIRLFGVGPYLMIQATVMVVAGGAGFWLFYVQHQFEAVQWKRTEDWNYTDAALHCSSYYKLPRVLQWCTGNIGFHHVHHLFPRIPNYHLEKCHDSLPVLQEAPVITLASSFGMLKFKLWDECSKRLVRFCDVEISKARQLDSSRSMVVDE